MFESARIKLTFWYVVIIFVIVSFFSFISYTALVNSAEHALMKQQRRLMRIGVMYNEEGRWLNRRLTDPKINLDEIIEKKVLDVQTLEEIKSEVAFKIFVIDSVILFISAILSYVLAGITLKPIKVMMEEQKRFFSNAAHELRTPLTVMKSNIDVVLMNKNPNKKDLIDTLKSNLEEIDNMQTLTDNLLKEQKMLESTKVVFKKLDIGKLTMVTVNKFETTAKKKNIELIYNGNSALIFGDENKIKELISILLDNAIKYSDKGGIVKIIVEKDKKYVNLIIKDNGVGMTKEEKEKIFNRFYRADKSRNENGYGLGLSIAKSIVALHDGKISVDSKKNVGTKVTVQFKSAS